MTKSKFAALAGGLKAEPKATPAELSAADLKKLTARIPLDVFQEFAQHRLDAERVVRLRRVTTEAATEALVRLLRDPATLELWYQEVVKVVDEQD